MRTDVPRCMAAQVQRIVARRALHAIEHAWNPLSGKQSAAVAALLKDLQVYLSPEDPILQARYHLIRTELKPLQMCRQEFGVATR